MAADFVVRVSPGDVYLNLLKFAQNEPLNRLRFNVDYRDANLVVGEPGVQTKARL